ncbi:MAG: LCP family protein, partial [Pseudonocardiaceae bacterium]
MRVARGAARTLAGLLSVAVLAASGVSWAGIGSLQDGLNTTDVIGAAPRGVDPHAGDGATDILLVGNDSRTDAQGNPLPLDVLKLLRTEESTGLNTDTIILIRVPDSGAAAHAVSIPRDTYVPIPGFRKDKINAAYGSVKSAAARSLRAGGVDDETRIERQSSLSGRRALVETVQQLTGVQIDHYAEVNLFGFYLLTEAIGGVEVCLNSATTDPGSGADFPAGVQTISGGDALAFVRQRGNLPRGDLDRIVRQQVFMAAAANKVLSTGTLTDRGRLSALMDAAKRSVVLDDGWNVLGFAQQMQGIAAGAVEFVTIPVEAIDARNERGQSIVTVDRRQVRDFVAGLLDGSATLPSPRSSAPPPAPAGPAGPDAAPIGPVTVSVLNGTDVDGLAAGLAEQLAAAGFDIGEVGNTEPRDLTLVRVGPGQDTLGEQVAGVMGGDIPVLVEPDLGPDQVLVLLGEDYPGQGEQRLGSNALLR